ncbi:protein phosphatase 2C domain-containing protein [Candidatus Woesearchaeota archaeon]|nr:protein phosphatase 2C domain-containing protein [Candidatus Woesearchaeota archaeon]
MVKVVVGASSYIGLNDRRICNEDACAYDGEHGVFVLADGAGGHAGGEIASSLAVEVMIKGFSSFNPIKYKTHVRNALLNDLRYVSKRNMEKNMGVKENRDMIVREIKRAKNADLSAVKMHRPEESYDGLVSLVKRLEIQTQENLDQFLEEMQKIVYKTHRAIFETSYKNPLFRGMATTIDAAVLTELQGQRYLLFCHVGDSSIYLVNKHFDGRIGIHKLTNDQTLAASDVARKIEEGADIGLWKYTCFQHGANLLHCALGKGEHEPASLEIQSEKRKLYDSNLGLLQVSDGVSDVLLEGEMVKIINEYWGQGPQKICEELVKLTTMPRGKVKLKMEYYSEGIISKVSEKLKEEAKKFANEETNKAVKNKLFREQGKQRDRYFKQIYFNELERLHREEKDSLLEETRRAYLKKAFQGMAGKDNATAQMAVFQ